MADKSSQLVLSALTRAAADTALLPLHGTRSTPGLFPATAIGKQAALRCCEDGYLSTSSSGNATITDKGLSYLLGQVSPRQVLEDFVRVMESREQQMAALMASVRSMQTGLEALRKNVSSVLTQVEMPGKDLKSLFSAFRGQSDPAVSTPAPSTTNPGSGMNVEGETKEILSRWAESGASEDCPLPELYNRLKGTNPGLSIGAFHDALRRMDQASAIYLHPWTGPLYAIPEPACALLVGHQIAYFASLRDSATAAA